MGTHHQRAQHGGEGTANLVHVEDLAGFVAHLLRLDVTVTAQALGVAAMLASGFMANAGTMTKPLAAGQSARNALLAVLLARDGFTASLAALEDRRGFLTLFNGAQGFDTGAMLENWREPYEIHETAVGLKRHPCCGVLQAAVDVMADLVATHRLVADEVARVEVMLISKRLGHVDRADPRSGVDAKFSLQYCVARTLERGRLEIGDFEGSAFDDPATRALMLRVDGSVHPSVGEKIARAEQGGAELRVTLRSGEIVSGFARKPFGRIAGEPLPEAMLHAKFIDCAERGLSSAGSAALLEALRDIDRVPRLREVSELMRNAARG